MPDDNKNAADNNGQPPPGQDTLQTALRAGEACREALMRIETLGLKPAPEIYELWYCYYQGDAEIIRAVDAHDGAFDEAACHRIYKKYLSENHEDDKAAVRQASFGVQSAIAELAGMLLAARSATNNYGSALEDVTSRIMNSSSLEDLGQMMTTIVEDTKEMVKKNQDLEVQLVNSSKQVTELRSSLDTLTREVMTDSLTSLSNRKAFDKQIRDCTDESARINSPVTLMLLDIDHFKKFNDSFGHQVGDQVLRLVARTLTDNVKGRDIAARYGGEEFAIILPDTPVSAGVKVAEALRKSVESKEVMNKATQSSLGRITLSIGIAEFQPGESVTSLIARADAALYEAKNAGRNRVQEAAPPK